MSLHEIRAELFQTLSLESRLLILDEPRYGEACVCHLQHYLQKPQPYISQQLHVLKDSGIVDTRREGVYIFYHIADPLARELIDRALGPADEARPADPECPCPHCAAR
jgi:ArsR family transcriptional regulator